MLTRYNYWSICLYTCWMSLFWFNSFSFLSLIYFDEVYEFIHNIPFANYCDTTKKKKTFLFFFFFRFLHFHFKLKNLEVIEINISNIIEFVVLPPVCIYIVPDNKWVQIHINFWSLYTDFVISINVFLFCFVPFYVQFVNLKKEHVPFRMRCVCVCVYIRGVCDRFFSSA